MMNSTQCVAHVPVVIEVNYNIIIANSIGIVAVGPLYVVVEQ